MIVTSSFSQDYDYNKTKMMTNGCGYQPGLRILSRGHK